MPKRSSKAGQIGGTVHRESLHRSLAIVCWVLASSIAFLGFQSLHFWGTPLEFSSGFVEGYFGFSLIPFLIAAGAINFSAYHSPGYRLSSCLGSALLALLAPIVVYASMGWIGFPDGSKTEFDRAMESTLPIFFGLSYAVAIFFLHLAWRSKRNGHRQGFGGASFSLVLLFVAAILTECWLYAVLDHGTGG